jgi:hypothetical protein
MWLLILQSPPCSQRAQVTCCKEREQQVGQKRTGASDIGPAQEHLPRSPQVRGVPRAAHDADDPTRGTNQRAQTCQR